MNKELLERAEGLWNQDKRLGRLGTRFDYIYAPNATGKIYEGMQQLESDIPERTRLANTDELYESELKRNLQSKILQFEHFLEGKPYKIEDIVGLYGLDPADLDALDPWLKNNKNRVEVALEELFELTPADSYELELYMDIPRVQRQAEGFAATQITNYHSKLSALFRRNTSAGDYLYKISPETSTSDRSYFASLPKWLALSMTRVCYQEEDGTIQLRERELLRLFGHEGMGHGLHQIITEEAKLPFFLKEASSASEASQEAVAQHYERKIFDDLHAAPDVQKDLKIQDRFSEIYQEEQNVRLVNEYRRRLFRFSLLVLANNSLGKPDDPEVIKKKVDLIKQHSINLGYARNMVENYRNEYDSEGNLDAKHTKELRYASSAVQTGLESFKQQGVSYNTHEGRSQIDMTFLTGFYTPIGFVQKASLTAEGKM